MKKKKSLKPLSKSLKRSVTDENELYQKIVTILEEARGYAQRAVNTAMVRAYWLIGQAIVEEEQRGQRRAGYGESLIESLAARLTDRYGKGFQARNLWWMRDFFLKFPILNALRSELSWTHYRLLLRVENAEARAYYEAEAAEGNWSTRQLERQITTFAYERVLLAKNKQTLLKQAREQAETQSALDFVKDPFVLEFLGLRESRDYQERELETALLNHLQEFMLELGKGFAFVGRQVRITLDGDHFYIDLVFYNYLLRCFVLLDLKLGKLAHQDLGQMQMYTNYYELERMLHGEKSSVIAARYQMYLPSEAELAAELQQMKQRLEQSRRLSV